LAEATVTACAGWDLGMPLWWPERRGGVPCAAKSRRSRRPQA